jgi:polysaccharide biosynthesis transport protein
VQVVEDPVRSVDRRRPLNEVDGGGGEEQAAWWSDLLEYAFLLRRHIWLMSISFLIVFIVVVFVGTRQQKIYRASTTVLVAYNPPKVLQEGDDIYQMSHRVWEYQRYFDTQPRVIESREVLQEAAQELDLANDVDFMGVADISDPAEQRRILAEADVVKRLRGVVEVEPLQDSLALVIYVQDPDRHRAADIANALADAYIGYQENQRLDATGDAAKWLGERVGQLYLEVELSENELMEFRRETKMLGSSLEDSLNLSSEQILAVNEALTRNDIEYVDLEARYRRAQILTEEGNRGAIPEVLASLTIRGLKEQQFELDTEAAEIKARYGDLHPRLQRIESQQTQIEDAIDLEIQRIMDSMAAELASLAEIHRRLDTELEEARDVALNFNANVMEFQRRERDLEQTEELYQQVRDRSLEAELAGMLQTSNLSVLDRATNPTRPFSPKLRFILLVAAFLATVASIGLVFLIDRLDSTVRTHEQLEKEFKLPVLGISPRVTAKKSADDDPTEDERRRLFIAREPRSAAAESCRTIRTNLMFMTPRGTKLKRLLVTSAGPSEGKTSFAANLAFTIASSGKRVVVVDTDMRRPKVHKVFGLAKDQGLTSALIGEIPVEKAIQFSGYTNLDVLPLGKVPPNPAELIDSDAFARLTEWLSSHYDVVIFDSPPVMAVTDASILAQFTDAVVFIVRQEKTNRHALRQGLKTLQSVNALIAGFVINDVDLEALNRGYYSSYRYRYRYPYYYHTYRYYSQYAEENVEKGADQPS